jgi:AcrR family transcriptional regulator
MHPHELAPKQQRSHDTAARLLQATISTLDRHGLEGTTIPRISAAAGVTPGAVYRRFQDRDALIRAALLDALEKSAEATNTTRSADALDARTLEATVKKLVALTIRQYRDRPRLMRAMTRFVEQDSDAEFRERALRLVGANYDRIVDVLLRFRQEIAHRDARRAVTFALLTMATVIEVRELEPVSMWHQLLPLTDDEVSARLARNFLAYLRTPRAGRTG